MGADSESTRQDILEAARDVIAERGYHAATFQQIAMRAGVSRPTLHYYFDSREDVYEVLLVAVHDRMVDCVDQARAEDSPRKQLARFIDLLQRWSVEENTTMRLLVAARLERQRDPRGVDAAARVRATVQAFYRSVVESAVRRGELSPDVDARAVADMLAAVFWGMGFHTGFITPRRSGDGGKGVARQLLQLLEFGLLSARTPASVDA